ncbi:unnamed protein product, partial [Aphanomyces euteiches]
MSAHQETKPTKSAHTSKFGRRAIDAAAEETSRSQSLPVQVDSSVQLESRSSAPVSRRSGVLGSVLSGMRPPPVVPGYSAKSSALPPAVPSATLEGGLQNEVVSGSATASPAAGGEDNLPSEPESEEDPSGSSQVESLPVQASNASEQPSALSGGDWDYYSRMLGISAEELKAAKDLDFEPSA